MKKNIKEIINNPLFSGSVIMVIGSNLVSFLNYLYHLILGRMLGPSGYGELASIISIIGLLGVIPGSLNLVIIKYVSGAKDEAETNNIISWWKAKIFNASLIFCVLILIISPLISSFLNIKMYYFWLISLSFLFSLQSLVNRSVLQGLLRFKQMVLSLLAENFTKVLFSIILVYIGLAVGGAMIALVLAALLGFFITNFYLRNYKKNNPKQYPQIKSMLLFIIPVFIQSISITSIYSSDVILVKHFFSSHDSGIYASLSTLGKIIFFATGPISGVMFPLISQKKSKGQEFKKVFIYSFLITSIFAITITLIYFFVPQFAIRLLFGSAYLDASELLVLFAIFIGLFALSSLLINFGLSLGETKIVIFPLLASIIQIVLISLFHESLFSVVWISIVITALLLLILLIYLSFRRAFNYGKKFSNGDKIDLSNRTGL